MRYSTFSLHKIVDKPSIEHLRHDYSRFKYGSKTVARQFGNHLAINFLTYITELKQRRANNSLYEKDIEFLDSIFSKQIVVVSSPYDFIPTATFAMKDYFTTTFNEGLVDLGLETVQETRISRQRSYNDDYGIMSAEERKQLIAGDKFHIDSEFVKGKFIIFLDDVYITGGHEGKMEEMVGDYNLECDYMYMYFGELVDKTTSPDIEHYLNHGFVSDLLDVSAIIRDDKFMFNTRVVKFILSRSEVEFSVFIAHQTEMFRDTLYHFLLGNKYHKLPVYKNNYLHLKNGSWLELVKSL